MTELERSKLLCLATLLKRAIAKVQVVKCLEQHAYRVHPAHLSLGIIYRYDMNLHDLC